MKMAKQIAVVALLLVVTQSRLVFAAGEAQLTLDSNVSASAGGSASVGLTYVASPTAGAASSYLATITKGTQLSLDAAAARACPASNANCTNVSTGLKQLTGTGIDANRIALAEEVGGQLLIAVVDLRAPSLGLDPTTKVNVPLTVASGATGTLPLTFDTAQTKVLTTPETPAAIPMLTTAGSIVLGGSGPTACDRNQDGACGLTDIFDTFVVWQKVDSGATPTAAEKLLADVDGNGTVDLSDIFAVFSAWIAAGSP